MLGSQEGVLLLHGLWHNSKSWQEVIDKLAQQNIKAYAPTLIGCDGNHPKSMQQIAETIVAFIDQQEEQCFHLVGHSFGGLVARAIALTQPKKIKTLTYLSAIVPKPGESFLSTMPNESAEVIRRFCKDGFSYLPFLVWKESFVNNNPNAKIFFKTLVPCSSSLLFFKSPQENPQQPSHYIQLTEDRVLPKSLWKIMYKNTQAKNISYLSGCHESLLINADATTNAIIRSLDDM